MGINIKSERELVSMREAGKIVAGVLDILKSRVQPGITTKELDVIAEREVKKLGAVPSFKGYRGYPASICVSINDEIVHGIPGKRVLRDGDIVSLDFGAIYNDYQGDSALTVGSGNIGPAAGKLIEATSGALQEGIKAARAGSRLSDISNAIQVYAEGKGFSVVKQYTGHGIGREMHEDPLIPNYGPPHAGPILKKGMTLAIEPMLNIGTWETMVDNDGWTVRTMDGSLSAHFEHTIAITVGDAEVLTTLL
jgi:methionyl aminopeptidase